MIPTLGWGVEAGGSEVQGHPQVYNQPRTYEAVSKKNQNQTNKETEKKKEKEKAVGGEEGRKEGIDLKLRPLRGCDEEV